MTRPVQRAGAEGPGTARAPRDHAAIRLLPWLIGLAIIALFYALDWRDSVDGVIRDAELWGRDFINLWSGGKIAATHDWERLYRPEAFMAFQTELFGPLDRHIYSYPPPSLFLAAPLAMLPYPAALLLWLGATGAAFVHAARPWCPPGRGWALLALATPAALLNIWEGHYGFLLGAIFLWGWRLLDARPFVAGAVFGLLILKPPFGLLIPLVLLLRRDWRAIAGGAAGGAAIAALSALVFGIDAWRSFFALSAGREALIDAHGLFFAKLSTSTATALFDVGAGLPLVIAGHGIVACLGVALVVAATLRRMPTLELAMLVATATFLVLPYGLAYDLPASAVGAWLVMRRARVASPDFWLAATGFVAPLGGMILAFMGLPLLPAMLAALAIAQYRSGLAQRERGDDGDWRPATG
ncbi:MAG: DUF2029 domain-containing protein [Sphingomonadales bacterium]|nr:DUF2029 domain-containing protein [Sphingomonadales bacterium]